MSESDSLLKPPPVPPLLRLASIDAYRGFVMFLMMAEILHLRQVADKVAEAGESCTKILSGRSTDIWDFLAKQQSHVEWVGCTLHDMIQPSFSFLVGVALSFSLVSRLAKGQSKCWMTVHAFWRALVLILLGVFLRSMSSSQTNWTFEDTLTQIGLGYGFLFMLGLTGSVRVQLGALLVILVGYWCAFAFYPLPGDDFDWAKAGVAADWKHHLEGFAAHWNKNTNPAWTFDVWFMNIFPRDQAFSNNGGGYVTLSFIPTLATMILGLLAGNLLRSNAKWWRKFGLFVVFGAICLGLGWGLDSLGVCPIVKRIWTPSWVLFSGGICFLILAAFYLFVDLVRLKFLVFPWIVIGTNSIVTYCFVSKMMSPFFAHHLKIHLGGNFFKYYGTAYEPLFLGLVVLLINWLFLLWLYRRKIFVKI